MDESWWHHRSCEDIQSLAWEKVCVIFLHEPQQTNDLKFADQLKIKSVTWLYFTILAVLAHNLFSLGAQKGIPPPPREIRKIENWIWLALIREHIHSPLLHHEKTTLKVVKKISRFDGSYFTVSIPWHIVYTKRREKKNTQSKKSYKAGNNSGKLSQFLQELSIFLHRKSPFRVAACRMDFHISCPLWSF